MPYNGILERIEIKEGKNPKKFWGWTYFFVFFIPLILGATLYFVFGYLGYSTKLDDDSTRYLLSAFIQSLAAIIAIVVTLTLVAIQFTASVYSTRVIDVFKKHPAMWAIISGYIIAISIFAFLLMSIADSQIIYGLKSVAVFYSYFLFIGLIVILIPHIRVTLTQMNSEKIIDLLIKNLTIEQLTDLKSEDDPFQDVFVVINSSALKGDMITFSYGLKKITGKFIEIIDYQNTEINLDYVCFRYCDDITRTSAILFEKREEKFIFEILLNLEKLTQKSIEVPNFIIYDRIPKLIFEIGNRSIESNLESVYSYSIKSISETFRDISLLYNRTEDENYLSVLKNLLFLFNSMAYKFMKSENSQYYYKIISEMKFDTEFDKTKIKSFSMMIELFVENLKYIVYQYMRSPECQNGRYYIEPIKKIGSFARIKNLPKDSTEKILSTLKSIGKDAYQLYDFPEITIYAKNKLFQIGISFIEDNVPELKDKPAEYVADLYILCPGLHSKEKEFENENKVVYGPKVDVDPEEYRITVLSILHEMQESLEPPEYYDDEGYWEAEAEYQKTRHIVE
jgi:hypothetical protein